MLSFLYTILFITILLFMVVIIVEYIGSLEKFVGTWKYELIMTIITLISITSLIIIFYYGL
jgi:hypothetical protein